VLSGGEVVVEDPEGASADGVGAVARKARSRVVPVAKGVRWSRSAAVTFASRCASTLNGCNGRFTSSPSFDYDV
jgi:hypothetical protein